MPKTYAPMSIELLGPLSFSLHHRPVVASAPKQRQVLALLALNVGRAVTVSTMVEELWGDTPPRSYATTLQTYILQIRNAIMAASDDDPDSRRLLSTRPYGYVLNQHYCEIDTEVFHKGVQAGRDAAEQGDYLRASALLSQALNLWRGPALVDVKVGRVLEIDVAALEEHRLGALERRVETDLALGRHSYLLAELTELTARHPLNENLCTLLMVALYRSGRAARAIQIFAHFRYVLFRELGIEPGPRMQRVLAHIRSGDAKLETGGIAWVMHRGASSERV